MERDEAGRLLEAIDEALARVRELARHSPESVRELRSALLELRGLLAEILDLPGDDGSR